jgi:hypothetical protein
MNYKHEIFISYKWGSSRNEWVDKVLYPILKEVMDDEMPTVPQIFKDTANIVNGAKLDASLQDALAHSKCMVCVVSLPYFAKSIWCPTEFSAMLYREEKTGVRQNNKHTGFIFPIIFVNREQTQPEKKNALYEYPDLRTLIFNFTPLELDQKYNKTNTAFLESKEYNDLKDIIAKWFVDSIKPVLQQDQPWKPEWFTEEYLLKPYEIFKVKYTVSPKVIALPSIR